jgi:hypothetical protein
VTEQEALTLSTLAVIEQFPAFMAVTLPLLSTVATEELLLLQATAFPSGWTVAFRETSFPAYRVSVVWEMDSVVGCTSTVLAEPSEPTVEASSAAHASALSKLRLMTITRISAAKRLSLFFILHPSLYCIFIHSKNSFVTVYHILVFLATLTCT